MPLPNILDAIMKRRPDGTDPAQAAGFFPGGQPTNPANVMPAPQALPPPDQQMMQDTVTTERAPVATPGGPAAILQASQAQPTAPSVQPEFYPNGVRKQAMDERTPDGKTVLEATQDAMNNGQGDNAGPTPAATPPSGPNIPDSPEYRQYQQAQADAAAPVVAPPPGKAVSTDPREKLRDLALNGAPPEKKWWKRMLQGALEGYAAGGLGGAAAGAGLQTFVPSINARSNTQRQIAQLAPRAEYLDKEDAAARQEKRFDAVTDNISTDNKLAQDKFEQAKIDNANRQEGIYARKLGTMQVFDPKNPAHRMIAKHAGLLDDEIDAMKGWDFKNPVEHVLNGQRFKLDRASGEYFPTNLGIDESKALTTFDAVDANGNVTATYHIPEEKAAQYAQAFRMKNMELRARSATELTRQQFQSGRQDARSADEAVKVLAAIRANAPAGTSEDDIVKRQQQYVQGLRPEIRAKLPQ